MKRNISLQFLGVAISSTLVFSSCLKHPPCNCNDSKPSVDVFATGLNNPRGLKFGPDGNLYVAEAGVGGKNSTVGKCMQIPAPLGPALGSPTGGRISRISSSGQRTTLINNLPTAVNQFGDVLGVSDVAFIGNTLYALEGGGGCSHGVPSVPNGIYKINAATGTHTLVANLSDWLQSHPNLNPEPNKDDFEPDGDWYGMVAAGDSLYATEANHQQIVSVNPTNGDIRLVIDFSNYSIKTWSGPTSITFHDNSLYFGDLTEFPIKDGAANIFKLSPGGSVQKVAARLTTVLGVTFDKLGQMYILETSVGTQFPAPGTGKIIRISTTGARDEIVSGLTFPSGLTYGPDGKLYVSNNGYGPDAIGGGQVLRVNLKTCDCNGDSSDYTTTLK